MKPGALRYLVDIQKPVEDNRRGSPVSYQYDRSAYASITPMKIYSKEDNEQQKTLATYQIKLWNAGAIDTTYRIVSGEYAYGIEEIQGDDPFSFELTLFCKREKL